jgi:hypothetical protein
VAPARTQASQAPPILIVATHRARENLAATTDPIDGTRNETARYTSWHEA